MYQTLELRKPETWGERVYYDVYNGRALKEGEVYQSQYPKFIDESSRSALFSLKSKNGEVAYRYYDNLDKGLSEEEALSMTADEYKTTVVRVRRMIREALNMLAAANIHNYIFMYGKVLGPEDLTDTTSVCYLNVSRRIQNRLARLGCKNIKQLRKAGESIVNRFTGKGREELWCECDRLKIWRD